ncbi:hypothetical protein H072_8838 [Dactylellina haptotyla CBS 200.50]|uniref:DNA replication regulator SLD2 n=1 Tax=Dactylellina haptotyla (strain CBS 200.50) TaxID=1284197 RepID=S8A8M4_DACHA|nr:hypothetical protein H072_8838 [Dactylellina haptotyla CBS 200.50]
MTSQTVNGAMQDPDRLRHLKLKIKTWEKDFAAKNDGKPPTRQDISANPKMAARYSEYQRLKKALHFEDSQSVSQNRQTAISKTPLKAPALGATTPLKTPSNPFSFTPTSRPEILGPIDSPSASAVRRLKWMTKGYVSPTPQKNGRVLGLFDKLPGITPTPPKRSREAEDQALLARLTESAKKSKILPNIVFDDSDEDESYTPLDPTTPSRKRRYEFQTPSKKPSPKTSGADPFATPTIFRQHSCNFELKENGSPVTPDLKRFLPNRGMIGKMKPLSALVQELREMQENEEDPGAEVLRELEQIERNPQVVTREGNKYEETAETPNDPPQTSNDASESHGAETTTKRHVYKKKGQKRQTKRVKMRPVRSQRVTQTSESDSESESNSESELHGLENHHEIMKEPIAARQPRCNGQEPEIVNDTGDKYTDLEDISNDELSVVAVVSRKTQSMTNETNKHKMKESTGAKKPASATKKATMVKPDKHQNFTRMKMHHKGKGFKGRGRR